MALADAASIADPLAMRHADTELLAAAMADSRRCLLRLFAAFRLQLGDALEVGYAAELNPPLWELGHIGWFEEYWIARNPERLRGAAANPDVARAAPLLRRADALYDSSHVAHATRWQLDLPDAGHTLALLARQRERTLALLHASPADDAGLYFFRLVLMHEDMHREAWAFMAQMLALDVGAALDTLAPASPAAALTDGELSLPAQTVTLGSAPGGFAFDNELAQHAVELPAFAIDRACVNWARYLPFVEAGGYDDERWWTREGWTWRQRHSNGSPRYLAQDNGSWQRATFGRWAALDPAQPAVNLTLHEAQAWCRWAGRRLPSEAEWECAAEHAARGGEAFHSGQVWEWTATAFAPYPGFTPHPYRDYSAPWFDGRPVLKGGSFASAPRIKHPRYRNFFSADRSDVFAGFRSCAV